MISDADFRAHVLAGIRSGIHRDKTGAIHIHLPKILRAVGWPDTPENRRDI